MARVFIDGKKVANVDLYRAKKALRVVVFTKRLSDDGPHAIQIRVLPKRNAASSGNRVDVDAFVLLQW